MDKLIYKGTMNDYRTFAEAGITEGSYNERAMQYFKYLGATADSFNEAYRQAMAIGPFTPLQLFANGEQGAWYDPSDLATLYQDAAGTTPVTADGDPVGLMLDKSGNGNHAKQETATRRPIYRTAAGLHWLELDGVDDYLELTSTVSVNGLVFSMQSLDTALAVLTSSSGSGYIALEKAPQNLVINALSLRNAVDTPSIFSIGSLNVAFRINRAGGFLSVRQYGDSQEFSNSIGGATNAVVRYIGAFDGAATLVGRFNFYGIAIRDTAFGQTETNGILSYMRELLP